MFIDIHAHAYRNCPPFVVQLCTAEQVLQRYDEAGDTEAEQLFWERARGMEVKMAIRRGMAGEDGEEQAAEE